MKTVTIIGYLFSCLWCLASTPQSLIKQGNVAYEQKDYASALAFYEEASVEAPKSAELSFNKGAIYYQSEEYDKAIESYKVAAVESESTELAASAKYNLGNCAFRLAKRQSDSDLAKAIEHCEESVNSYLEALDLYPENTQASENIEIVRLFAKTLIDAQKQQEQQQQDQKQEENNLIEKLKKVAQKQSASLQSPITAPEQKSLQSETMAIEEEIRQTKEQLQQQMNAPKDPDKPSPAQLTEQMADFSQKLDACKEHVSQAVAEQQKAISQLSATPPTDAKEAQTQALVQIAEAIKALSDEDDKDQKQDQQNKDGEGEKSEDEQKQQPSENGESDPNQDSEQESNPSESEDQDSSENQESQDSSNSEEEKEQEAQQARAETADDILNEEKNNQKQMRPLQQRGRMQRVDKDW